MLNYWLLVVTKAFWDSVSFIGQSRSGIIFALLVIGITLLWLWKKHGWEGAVKHWVRTAGEGVVIAVVAFLLVLIGHFIFEPYLLQEDMGQRWEQAKQLVTSTDNQLKTCAGDLNSESKGKVLLADRVSAQQQTIDSI